MTDDVDITTESVGEDIAARVPAIGKAFLFNPISHATRKLQTYVLITSVVTALLSRGTLEISKATAIGLEIKSTHKDALVTIAGLFLIYFLAMYLIELYRDLALGRLKRLMPATEIEQVTERLSRYIATTIERFNALRHRVDQLLEERQKAGDEILKTIHVADPLDLAEMDRSDLRQKAAEARFAELCATDGLDDVIAEMELIDPDAVAKKVSLLMRPIAAGKRLDRARTLAEVLFPISLAVYALWSLGVYWRHNGFFL